MKTEAVEAILVELESLRDLLNEPGRRMLDSIKHSVQQLGASDGEKKTDVNEESEVKNEKESKTDAKAKEDEPKEDFSALNRVKKAHHEYHSHKKAAKPVKRKH